MYSLYLLHSELGSINQWKIGITSNLTRRMNELKVANPNLIRFASTYLIESRNIAYGVEALIKKHLRLFTISGEWIFWEALTINSFQELCQKYEKMYRTHLEIEKNIHTKYDN